MANIQKLTYPYFTDGTTQLNAANLNPIIAKMNEMIEAINSGVTPTPTQTVATPVITISGNSATITCATSGATIRYTTNGSVPTSSSTQYTTAITLSGATTIKAIAIKDGVSSSVATQSYTPSQSVATPVINISGNTATITCATSGATIKYTTDGSIPSASNGKTYSSAITLSTSCTIKAIAIKDGVSSSVATQTYTPSQSYDSDTEAIANRFSNITTAKKNALDTFVRSLKSSGVYSKIDYLALPAIAANVTEATQNALGGEGVVVNGTSVALSNNGLSPIIGEAQMLIDNLSVDLANTHISFFTNNAATPVTGKWDVALCFDNMLGFGKAINAASPGLYYTNSANSAIRWTPSELSAYKTTALTHVIAVSASTKVALSLNGTYVEQSDSVKASSYQSNRIYFGQSSGINSHIYQAQDSEGSFGGISAFKYGLISKGKALSQTECIAFNNAVTAFMNSILG